MKAVLMMELTNDVRPVRREIETQQFRTCCDLEKKPQCSVLVVIRNEL